MKTNLVRKTVGKWKLWTAILSVLVVAGIVIACVFGWNTSPFLKPAKTLTVEYSQAYESKLDAIQDVCETKFSELGVSPVQTTLSTSVDGEIIYYFDENVDLSAVETGVKAGFTAATQEGGTLAGASFIKVRTNTETVLSILPQGYILRAAIAAAVFTVLAFAYVSLRYKLSMGLVMAATTIGAGALTAALVALVRIPVTTSFAYVVLLSMLAAAVMTLVTFNRLRDAAKENDKEVSVVDKTVNAVATKHVLIFACSLAVATILLGAIVPAALWFSVTALVGLVAATFAAWIFAPALFVILESAIKIESKPKFRKNKKEKKIEDVAEQAPETAEEPQA